MRGQGLTVEEIAARLKVSADQSVRLLSAALKERRKQRQILADTAEEEFEERIDHVFRLAMAEHESGNPKAMDMLVKLLYLQRDVLWHRQEAEGKTPTPKVPGQAMQVNVNTGLSEGDLDKKIRVLMKARGVDLDGDGGVVEGTVVT